MIEQYYSNDWLVPLGERTKEALKDFPREKALAVASVVYAKEGLGQPYIPWTIVFDSDDLDDSLDKLERTLKIPLGISPENDEEIREGVALLRRIIGEAGANSYATAAHASMHMLKAVHGDTQGEFRTYQDLSRFYPQYAGEWENTLITQFGKDYRTRLTSDHSQVFAIQELDVINSQNFDERSLQIEGEVTADFTRRAFEAVGIVGLEEMTRILNRRLMPYQEAAHKIRGLEISLVE